MESTLLELIDITKYFPGVLALDHVNFDIKAGEVHVLMGENGAGKSTLMKIIDGIYQPDEGIIKINGQEKKITSPFYAIENGIAMIHQELNTVLDLSVAENIFLGREYGKGIFYNRKLMIKEAGKALNQLGIQIDPKQKMRELSVAKRQMVEIAKAVTTNAKVLIMDEPTSAISDTEVDALFKIIDDFKKKNVGIVYISHKMDEIFRIADRITVLRDGKTVGTYATKDISVDQLITQMVGRNIKNIYPPRIDHEIGDEILKIRNISSGNVLKKISFSVHQGEIVGLAGLMGSGRSELAEVIFGLRTHEEGEIIIHGQKIKITKPLEAILRGMEEFMCDFVTEPEYVEKMLDLLCDGKLKMLDFLEENNLLAQNTEGTYVGSGGFGYTSEIPTLAEGEHVTTHDMWGFCDSQETVSVNPEMYGEFILPRHKKILERFALTCYGCCEPYNVRWKYVKQLPNLRRVSVSPWADWTTVPEYLGKRYIASVKPLPTPLASYSMNEDVVRRDCRKAAEQTKGGICEFIMKDNNTLGRNPNNAIRWVEIMREEIDRVYK